MMRLFMPLVLTALAIALFVLYTNPAYQTIKTLSVQKESYGGALNKAQELRGLRDSLLGKRNAFAQSDLDKVQHILPDNVDNIRLIIDINNIASRHNLSLTNVELGDTSRSPTNQAAAASDAGAVGSVQVGFSVSTSNYNDFLAFLQDLEHSLRLVNVNKISFGATVAGTTAYTMSVNTYWLH